MRNVLAVLFYSLSMSLAAAPCDGVERHSKPSEIHQYKSQLGHGVAPFYLLRSGDWSVVWASFPNSEPGMRFYFGTPPNARLLTTWGGTALKGEEAEIHAWVLQNAPGISEQLAICFAWLVANER